MCTNQANHTQSSSNLVNPDRHACIHESKQGIDSSRFTGTQVTSICWGRPKKLKELEVLVMSLKLAPATRHGDLVQKTISFRSPRKTRHCWLIWNGAEEVVQIILKHQCVSMIGIPKDCRE